MSGPRAPRMNLALGVALESPPVLVPWSATRRDLLDLFPAGADRDGGIQQVTACYLVQRGVTSLGGLNHAIGFHLGLLGRLARVEYFRAEPHDLRESFADFQRRLEQALGAPTRRDPGPLGVDRAVWRVPGAEVLHELVERFGPEEHLWMVRRPRCWE